MAKKTHTFCTVEELENRLVIVRWVDCLRDELSAILSQEKIFVVSSICPHFGGPLRLLPRTSFLRCPWHGLQFDLNTGHCITSFTTKKSGKFGRMMFNEDNDSMPAYDHWCLSSYEFRVKDNLIEVFYDDDH